MSRERRETDIAGEEIVKLLKELNNTKSLRTDKISPGIVKEFAIELAEGLKILFKAWIV